MDDQINFRHQDIFSELNKESPLSEKIAYLHKILQKQHEFIHHMAVAIHDPETDLLKTYIHSSDASQPLTHYQAKLSEAKSLQEILERGKPRVVNDLGIFDDNDKEHSKRIRSQGFAASYTLPMFLNNNFFGFIFFNSLQKNVFIPEVLHYLDLYGHLLSLTVVNELTNVRTLLAAIKTTTKITHQRDFETGAHLERMSRYSRLIAMELAAKYNLTDEFIEHVFMFSPLHDIGKIGIPDKILLKPGKLTTDEFEIMKTHTVQGRELIGTMLENFGLGALQQISILQNIVEYHHEAIDGSGYPKGLTGEEIPIEARIVAVADVFDALTSIRPYKEAWDNSRAYVMLKEMTIDRLDANCVDALLQNRDKVEEIQQGFQEDSYG